MQAHVVRSCPCITAELRHGRAGVGLLHDRQNLAVGVTECLDGGLLGLDYEKIPFPARAIFRKYYLSKSLKAVPVIGWAKGLSINNV